MVSQFYMERQRVIILTTGGTIEKSYSEFDGSLRNRQSMLKNRLLSKLRLPHTDVDMLEVMAKDSLHMSDEDRQEIWLAIKGQFDRNQAILVLHGTDTMELTAKYCFEQNDQPPVPVVFTGAMKPMGFEDSDALQNFSEALVVCHVLSPGFYVSFHNRVFKVPDVQKNRRRRTFEASE